MSPDLDVAIESPALTPSRAQAIAHSSWPPDALWVAAQAPSWWRKLTKKETRLSSLHLGAHDILDEEADWNAATWLFEAEQLPRFASTLRRLYELLPEEFTMLAAWGDPPVREEVVTRDGLLRAVLSNELGNAVLYRVQAATTK